MKKLTRLFARGLLTCMLVALFMAVTPAAYAEYEIDTSSQDFSISVPTDGTIVQWTEDVVVSWEKPTMTGSDVLNGFVYKWNTSDSALDDDALNILTNDGEVSSTLDPPTLTRDAADFAGDDSNYIRYLHIKTWYLDSSTGQTDYSDDVVIGPINIDNVAPTGTVRITDDEGSDITTTYSSSLNLQLSASLTPIKMYLSETDTRGGSADYASEIVYGLIDENTGEKTIYVWFEDGVGNISTAPATDTVTLLALVSIKPYEPTLDLATASAQVFAVDGNDDSYTWSIIGETPDTGGDVVAEFSGDVNTGNSVTVNLLNPGTFKLQAVGATTLTSGTITVIKGTVSKTFSLITTATTNVNSIGFIFADTGISTAHELGTAVGNCDLVSKWDEATQSYSSHPMAAPTFNSFDLEVGKAYFVSVTSDHDFTLTGKLPTSITLNLVTTATTNVNAVGVPKSKENLTKAHQLGLDVGNVDLVSKWDVPTQSYSSHPMAAATFNDFDIEWGNGYFISVTQTTQWNW